MSLLSWWRNGVAVLELTGSSGGFFGRDAARSVLWQRQVTNRGWSPLHQAAADGTYMDIPEELREGSLRLASFDGTRVQTAALLSHDPRFLEMFRKHCATVGPDVALLDSPDMEQTTMHDLAGADEGELCDVLIGEGPRTKRGRVRFMAYVLWVMLHKQQQELLDNYTPGKIARTLELAAGRNLPWGDATWEEAAQELMDQSGKARETLRQIQEHMAALDAAEAAKNPVVAPPEMLIEEMLRDKGEPLPEAPSERENQVAGDSVDILPTGAKKPQRPIRRVTPFTPLPVGGNRMPTPPSTVAGASSGHGH